MAGGVHSAEVHFVRRGVRVESLLEPEGCIGRLSGVEFDIKLELGVLLGRGENCQVASECKHDDKVMEVEREKDENMDEEENGRLFIASQITVGAKQKYSPVLQPRVSIWKAATQKGEGIREGFELIKKI